MKRRLKKSVLYFLYAVACAFVIGGVFLLETSDSKQVALEMDDYVYVSQSIFDDVYVPVVSAKTMIVRPYTDSDVNILIGYYDMKASEEEQRSSLLYYEGTYMPSSGIYYGKEEQFDAIAILDGKVTEVKEDTTLGNSITIEHANNVTTTYQSVTDITVKVGDTVSQGTVIGKSSTSNIASSLNNHLYFEMNINGKTVNPENYYEKAIDEL